MPQPALSDGPVLGLTHLGIELSTDTAAAEARLSGELDMLTAPRLQAVVDQLLDAGYLDVTADLSEVGFLGCAGLTVLALAGSRYRAAGGSITVAGPSSTIRAMLRITGLDTTFASGLSTTSQARSPSPGCHRSGTSASCRP